MIHVSIPERFYEDESVPLIEVSHRICACRACSSYPNLAVRTRRSISDCRYWPRSHFPFDMSSTPTTPLRVGFTRCSAKILSKTASNVTTSKHTSIRKGYFIVAAQGEHRYACCDGFSLIPRNLRRPRIAINSVPKGYAWDPFANHFSISRTQNTSLYISQPLIHLECPSKRCSLCLQGMQNWFRFDVHRTDGQRER